jgi:arsenate reductase (glutaredoxin)
VLRVRDQANRALGLTGEEDEEVLVRAMAAHPTLLQRPIGARGDRAVVGRPPEALLELLAD